MSPWVEGLRGVSVEEALAEPMEANLTPESMQRAAAVLAGIGTREEYLTSGSTTCPAGTAR